MRQSQLFGKTIKETPKDITAKSHELLTRGGFIRESRAGRYYFLPLGRRVQLKIIALIRKIMDRSGSQEMITPVLHPMELWEETNRNTATGFELMKIQDRRGAEFALGGTAEEMMIDLVRQFQMSYKDMPFSIYQFSTKFRDEMRARGGLLRVREFVMKDAYSFHHDEDGFVKEYQKMWDAYIEIYDKLGLKAVPVLADNGYIGGDYCHEFIVESPVGESTYFVTDDESYLAHEDVAEFKREEINPEDEILPLEIVEQPEWVKTMDDNVEHYQLPKSRFLKNVVYTNIITNEIIIVVIRGDLDVNKTKVEQKLDMVGQLQEATEKDLASFGSQSGWVHSWGHEGVRYVGDISLTTVRNLVGGQKAAATDTINVNYGRDFECEVLDDFALAQEGFLTADGKVLHKKTGVEVGNIFQLGYHYSNKMNNAVFVDQDGKNQKYYMGCYGIGIGRTLATIVEKHHDENGIIWPEAIAPYQVHLIVLGKDDEILKKADSLYSEMLETGIEVLYDDRKVSTGNKLNDSDLIGIPHRVIMSSRSLENGGVEYKRRDADTSEIVSTTDIIKKLG